ncbi:MAG: helix-turn-helix domain-containing protein [Lachnospiraceae bacterium]|nr:helix-turn-helix domain-containing protein [Lachnospiraceae bacterium]
MISNQILQSTLDGLKEIIKVDMGVIDTDGRVLAATFESEGGFKEEALHFSQSVADSQEIQGYQFFKVYDEQQLEYMVVVPGKDEESFTAGKVASFQIQSLQVAYKERFDRDNFIKNLLLDNLLLVDIYNRSQKLHISTETKRVVIVAEIDNYKEFNALESIKGLMASRQGDFVTAVDEKGVVVVREVGENEGYEEISATAGQIYELISEKSTGELHVSYGTIVKDIREVSRSYKEAKMALDVGKIFFDETNVIAYSELGIGRLIYQLPIPLCKMFIKEIFDGNSPDDFDEEMITTINKFFENSLNVSETSRQLFIHRNTLVYRLDKLEKITGLDIRVFEDAITFKISLMVSKYMKYMEKN